MRGMVRNPLMVLLLSLITCGLYGLYWIYAIRTEMKDYLEDPGISPGLELLFMIICFPYYYYWAYKVGQDLMRMQRKAGIPEKDNSVILIVLAIFGLGIVNTLIIQDNLNEVWQAR